MESAGSPSSFAGAGNVNRFIIFAAFAVLLAVCIGAVSSTDVTDADVGDYFTIGGIEYTVTQESPDRCVEVSDGGNSDIVVIPSSVTHNEAVYSVTAIGDEAFSYGFSLESVTIPDSVLSIGEAAFYFCMGLTSITIPDSVEYIGPEAFALSSLVSVIIPDGVTAIEDETFTDCLCLTSITIPDSVTSIGRTAFEGCSSLESVTIPRNVEYIGPGAFYDCWKLTWIHLDEGNTHYSSREGILFSADGTTLVAYPSGRTDVSYEVPSGVTCIAGRAFPGCYYLKSITIPDSVTSICAGAFCGCINLIQVNVPDGMTEIGEETFYGCKKLVSVVIPDGVTAIGEKAFYGCNSLADIVIPDSVTSIGEYAFRDCDSFTGITIPDSVTSIGSGAFWSCDGLECVIIGNGLTEINSFMFAECSSLTAVTIPGSVTSISNYVFYDCPSVEKVIFEAGSSPLTVGNIRLKFYDTDGNETAPVKDRIYQKAGGNLTELYVTFDANGGSPASSKVATGADGRIGEMPSPTFGVHNCRAWNTAADGSGEAVTAGTVHSDFDTAYAFYTTTVTVTIDAEKAYNGSKLIVYWNDKCVSVSGLLDGDSLTSGIFTTNGKDVKDYTVKDTDWTVSSLSSVKGIENYDFEYNVSMEILDAGTQWPVWTVVAAISVMAVLIAVIGRIGK